MKTQKVNIDYLLHKHGVVDTPAQIPLVMKIVIDESLRS